MLLFKVTDSICVIKQFAVLFSTLQLSRYDLFVLSHRHVVIIACSLPFVKSFFASFLTALLLTVGILACFHDHTLKDIPSPDGARVLSHAC